MREPNKLGRFVVAVICGKSDNICFWIRCGHKPHYKKIRLQILGPTMVYWFILQDGRKIETYHIFLWRTWTKKNKSRNNKCKYFFTNMKLSNINKNESKHYFNSFYSTSPSASKPSMSTSRTNSFSNSLLTSS